MRMPGRTAPCGGRTRGPVPAVRGRANADSAAVRSRVRNIVSSGHFRLIPSRARSVPARPLVTTCGSTITWPSLRRPGSIRRVLFERQSVASGLAASRLDLLDPADVAALGGIEVVARGVVEGFLSGLHRSPFRGFSVEFAEHRPYQPGDELRSLDWKILGRRDRLYVKQYEEETNLRATLVLDISRSMHWKGSAERGLTKLDYATRLAAALALVLLRQRDATGLIAFDDAVRSVVPPRARSGQWHQVVRALMALEPGGGAAARDGDLRLRPPGRARPGTHRAALPASSRPPGDRLPHHGSGGDRAAGT